MNVNRYVPKDAYPAGDMPPYPARTLIKHVAWKNLQVGAVLGVLATPIYAFTRKVPAAGALHKCLLTTVTFAQAAGFGMVYWKWVQGALDADGVDDRAYRLSKNAGQLKIDALSYYGAGVGAAVGAIVGRGGVRHTLTGSVLGVAAACAVYGGMLATGNAPGSGAAAAAGGEMK